ncbi:MAG TPA: hypothetical protein VGI83_00580, partial [Gemmatimonadales bacterium]
RSVQQHLFQLGNIGSYTNLPASVSPMGLLGGLPFWILDYADPTVGITVLGFAEETTFEALLFRPRQRLNR